MKKNFGILVGIIMAGGTSFGQDSLAFDMIVRNVVVPIDQIVLDSAAADKRYYYSGVVKFDVESPLDSVHLHLFFEEIPFKRYRIMKSVFHGFGEDTFTGNTRFIQIDSLCTGDVGWIKPKSNCIAHWKYSTKNRHNHCRIKVGMGNYSYVNTKIETSNSSKGVLTSKQEFQFNSIGLLARSEEHTSMYGPAVTIIKVPEYTTDGQLVVDDTISPFVKNVYDNQRRAIFMQKANKFLLHFIFGYVYDSCARAIQRRHLPFGSDPFQQYSDSSNTEYITYDDFDRIGMHASHFYYEQFNLPNPYKFIEGTQIIRYYYRNPASTLRDSSIRDYYDANQSSKLVAKIINRFIYRQDNLLEESTSISKGYDDSGACWGTQLYQERKLIIHYDSLKFSFRQECWGRNSPDSVLKPMPECDLCCRREYDKYGNTIRQFDGCDQNEKLAWEAHYNKFNFIISQTGFGTNVITDTSVTTYQWSLLDLDKQKKVGHE